MFAQALKLVLSLPDRKPSVAMPKALDPLFATLQAEIDEEKARQTEDLIRELWVRHIDPGADRAMQEALACIIGRKLDQGEEILSELVQSHPQWAEAWNQRATVRFLGENHTGAVDDIMAALSLEPRHFRWSGCRLS